MRVAIIDDDLALRSVLVRVVRCFGFEVSVEACDGEEALQLLGAFPADVIVTDCQMPKMDGICLTRTLRSKGDIRPILMLSGQTEPAVVQAALKAGVTRYLSKPLNVPEFFHVLRQLTREEAAA
jgi:two-component system, OmpR family, response regulator MprA